MRLAWLYSEVGDEERAHLAFAGRETWDPGAHIALHRVPVFFWVGDSPPEELRGTRTRVGGHVDIGPARGVALFGSNRIHDAVLGDADQPGGERAPSRIEAFPRLPGADEHLLGGVFGPVLVELAAAQ